MDGPSPGLRARLAEVFGADVVSARYERLGGRRPKVWVVGFADGRVVVLGTGGRVRNASHLSTQLAMLGRPPVSVTEALRISRMLRLFERQGATT